MVGRAELCVNPGKMWIPLTNYGKNYEEFGFTLISSFLRGRFGLTPNCSIVNAQPLRLYFLYNKIKFLLKAAGNKQKELVKDNGRGRMHTKCHSVSRQSIQPTPLLMFH